MQTADEYEVSVASRRVTQKNKCIELGLRPGLGVEAKTEISSIILDSETGAITNHRVQIEKFNGKQLQESSYVLKPAISGDSQVRPIQIRDPPGQSEGLLGSGKSIQVGQEATLGHVCDKIKERFEGENVRHWSICRLKVQFCPDSEIVSDKGRNRLEDSFCNVFELGSVWGNYKKPIVIFVRLSEKDRIIRRREAPPADSERGVSIPDEELKSYPGFGVGSYLASTQLGKTREDYAKVAILVLRLLRRQDEICVGNTDEARRRNVSRTSEFLRYYWPNNPGNSLTWHLTCKGPTLEEALANDTSPGLKETMRASDTARIAQLLVEKPCPGCGVVAIL